MIRVLSALTLITVLIVTIWLLPFWVTAMLAAMTAARAGVELADLSGRGGAAVSATFVSLAAAALTLAFVVSERQAPGSGDAAPVAVLLTLLVVGGTLTLGLGPLTTDTLTRAAIMSMAPTYLGLPLGSILWVQWAAGPLATTWLLGTIALSDSAQYYCGRLWGRRKLAPVISPGKTTEGAIGGLVAAGVGGLFLGPVCLPGLSPFMAAVTAVVLATAGIAGDLFESLLKRSVGVKDTASVIPGHGGVLDRIDSYLFAAPVFYLFLRYLR